MQAKNVPVLSYGDEEDTVETTSDSTTSQAEPVRKDEGRIPRPSTAPKPRNKPTSRSILKKNAENSEKKNEEDAEQGEPLCNMNVTPEAVLEAKRRKTAYKVMLKLLENGAVDESDLAQVAAPLSGDEIKQVAEERSLSGRCGNPCCVSTVRAETAQTKRWHAKADDIEAEDGAVFCSRTCEQLVARFSQMLGDPLKRLRPDARDKLLVSHQPKTKSSQPEVAAQVNGVTTMLAEIQEKDSTAIPDSVHDFPEPGSSSAVEGYVPRAQQQHTEHAQQQAQLQTLQARQLQEQQRDYSTYYISADSMRASERLNGLASIAEDDGKEREEEEQQQKQQQLQQDQEVDLDDEKPGSKPEQEAQQAATAAVSTPHASATHDSSSGGVDTARIAAGVAKHISMLVDDVSASSMDSPSITTANAATDTASSANTGVQANAAAGTATAPAQPSSTTSQSAPQNTSQSASAHKPASGQLPDVFERYVDPAIPPRPPSRPSNSRGTAGAARTSPPTADTPSSPTSILKKAGTSSASSSRRASLTGHSSRRTSNDGDGEGTNDTTSDGARNKIRKKRVSWADDFNKELNERFEYSDHDADDSTDGGVADTRHDGVEQPQVPVLVFTLEGDESNMEGSLTVADVDESQVKGVAGNTATGAAAKKLAGKLQVADASKLSTLAPHQVTAAAASSGTTTAGIHENEQEAVTGEDTDSEDEGTEGTETPSQSSQQRPKAPKALRMWFPASAGGIGVAVPKQQYNKTKTMTENKSNATKPTTTAPSKDRQGSQQQQQQQASRSSIDKSSSEPVKVTAAPVAAAATNTGTRRFTPVIPGMKQSAAKSVAVSKISVAATPLSNATNLQKSSSRGAGGLAGTNQHGDATKDAGSGVDTQPSPMIKKFQQQRSRVVMLDAPPDKQLSENPVLKRMHARPAASDNAIATPATTPGNKSNVQSSGDAAASVNAGSEKEPVGVRDSSVTAGAGNVTSASTTTSKKGITVIKSDAKHAAALQLQKPFSYDVPDDDANGGDPSDLSDQEEFHPEHQSHASSTRHQQRSRQHSSQQNMDDSDTMSEDEGQEQQGMEEGVDVEDDSDLSSDNEGGEKEGRRGVKSKVRKVRGDVIYEDEDLEGVGDLADLQDTLREVQGLTSDSEVDDNYNSAVPFFGAPPKGFRLELSPFNLLWSSVSSWVTRETLQYMNAVTLNTRSQAQQPTAKGTGKEESSTHNGSVHGDNIDGDSDQDNDMVLSALPPPTQRDFHARGAFANLLLPQISDVVKGMKISVAVTDIEKRVLDLLRTFVFPGPLPTFTHGQWRLLALSIVRALSMARLPAIAQAFDREDTGACIDAFLADTGFEKYHLSSVVDLLLYD